MALRKAFVQLSRTVAPHGTARVLAGAPRVVSTCKWSSIILCECFYSNSIRVFLGLCSLGPVLQFTTQLLIPWALQPQLTLIPRLLDGAPQLWALSWGQRYVVQFYWLNFCHVSKLNVPGFLSLFLQSNDSGAWLWCSKDDWVIDAIRKVYSHFIQALNLILSNTILHSTPCQIIRQFIYE